MKISKLLKEHPSLTHPEDMATLIQPLKNLGVTYFGYGRVNEKGELATLSSDPKFLEAYYQEGFYDYDLHANKPLHTKGYLLWDSVQQVGLTKDLYEFGVPFGIHHTFSIVEVCESTRHVYYFATKPGTPGINDFYLQNIGLLEKFVAHFKDQLLLNDRLNRAFQTVTKVNTKLGGYLTDARSNHGVTPQQANAFLKALNPTQAHTIAPDPLPRREAQCAHYLLQGKTAREIGALLHLSPRTVDVYFERLKQRFGVKTRIELLREILMMHQS